MTTLPKIVSEIMGTCHHASESACLGLEAGAMGCFPNSSTDGQFVGHIGKPSPHSPCHTPRSQTFLFSYSRSLHT